MRRKSRAEVDMPSSEEDEEEEGDENQDSNNEQEQTKKRQKDYDSSNRFKKILKIFLIINLIKWPTTIKLEITAHDAQIGKADQVNAQSEESSERRV